MIREYRGGQTTDAVFRAVLGTNAAEVDTRFRVWGESHGSSFRDDRPWPYDDLYSLDIDPEVVEGIRFSRR